METIQFNTVVQQDQVIRPPSGIILPLGEIEVTVRARIAPVGGDDALAPTRAWLLNLATEAEQVTLDLPSDLAEHHDYYAHGKPRP
jgi:hypothetical protein